jgi:5'-nucleotidase
MNILVTNDDGVTVPGLMALSQAMRPLGDIYILAPDRNWSGGGHVKTLDRPLRVKEVRMEDGFTAFASDGAPSDCVALALLGFFNTKFDLVVSGINPTLNLGHDVTYSGTVTAAMEAVIWGVPGIAFSLGCVENGLTAMDYQDAAQITCMVVESSLPHRIPTGILLNVNIPLMPFNQVQGFRITRQGLRVYHDRLDRRVDPRGRPYYWIGGDSPTGVPEDDSDIGALVDGYVSITPIQLDLTAYAVMPDIRSMVTPLVVNQTITNP